MSIQPIDAQAEKATPNDDLFFLVEISFAKDKTNREAWVDHAARLHERVQEIGGYAQVYPKTINSFAYNCPDRAVREKLLVGVTSAYADILADKERLSTEERRVVSFITLVSMANPSQTEPIVASIKSAYAAHGLEIPKSVADKVAERAQVAQKRQEGAAERERIALERRAHAFRKPYLHKGMSFEEKAQTLRALGYRLDTRDMQGNLHFVGRDPITGEVVKQVIYGERRNEGGRGGLHGGPGRKDDTPDAPALIETRDGRWISAPTKHKEIAPLSDEERAARDKLRAAEKAAADKKKADRTAAQAAKAKASKKGSKNKK